MKRLTFKEWIGVAVALAVVIVFLLGGTIAGLFNSGQDEERINMENDQVNGSQAGGEQAGAPTGEVSRPGSTITVHYTGKLQNGQVFDSSVGRGPFTFQLGAGYVIKGWDEGLVGVRAGEKKTLTVSPSEGYGAAQGHPLQNETLIFDVEVLEVRNQ